MVDIGVLSCNQSSTSAYCIINIIECVISALMLLLVLIILIRRLFKQRRINFNSIVLIIMTFILVFIVAFSVDSDIKVFNFLYLFFYNAYFSIIVLKLGLKVQQKYKQSKNYNKLQKMTYILFAIYNIFVLAALIYSIINREVKCLYQPFLIMNGIGFFTAVIFLILGINHLKWQQQKFDQNIPQKLKNNPMPRFKIWIITNCISQLMILVQAIIFQVKQCKFSENITLNAIISLFFVFLSFHMGIFSTIYFFLYAAPHNPNEKALIGASTEPSSNQEKRQVEMVYYYNQDNRTKNISI